MEQALVDHVSRGEWLDLAADDEAVDETAMQSWGESRTCRASVIRDILRGRLVTGPDPHGLRLRGARIYGRLDLQNLTTDVNFELTDCLLEEGILARDARLAFVGLNGCQLEHPAEPPLDAARLTCSLLILSGARIIGYVAAGVVCLLGARIDGNLDCSGATLRNDSGPALAADSMQVGQSMLLHEGFTAAGAGEGGVVRLLGARIDGNLDCSGATLRNDSGPALAADSMQVGQSMLLHEGFTAAGAGEGGVVRLLGARIDGNLDCSGATLRNDSGPALAADSMQVGQSMLLHEGFTAAGAGEGGVVRLLGARIDGNLDCSGATLRNDSGPALAADSMQVGQSMLLHEGFTAAGAGEGGVVRLLGARIDGNLDCSGATLRNDSGPALAAEGMRVGRDMYLRSGFSATGGGDDVAVDLTGARVSGALVFAPAQLEHATDPHRRIAVDGLTYPGVPGGVSARDLLDLLRNGTPRYVAQPYQQLATGYRARGDKRRAREVLMAQRDDQLARTEPRWRERLWGWITKATGGYGGSALRIRSYSFFVTLFRIAAISVVIAAPVILLWFFSNPKGLTRQAATSLLVTFALQTLILSAVTGFAAMATLEMSKRLLHLRGWFFRQFAAIRALPTGGYRGSARRFDLPLEQLVAQVGYAADRALDELFVFREEREREPDAAPNLELLVSLLGEAALQRAGEDPTRLRAQTQAALDDLQVRAGNAWRWRLRLASCVLAALFALVALIYVPVPPGSKIAALAGSFLLGGFFAGFFRDLAALVERFRRL